MARVDIPCKGGGRACVTRWENTRGLMGIGVSPAAPSKRAKKNPSLLPLIFPGTFETCTGLEAAVAITFLCPVALSRTSVAPGVRTSVAPGVPQVP